MSEQFWWYLARAGGMVAWGMLAASAVLGLCLAGRLVPRSRTPWVNEIHAYLGGLATVFTAIHVIALVADNYVHFGIADIVVPFASSYEPLPTALGVVALYMLVAVEATSLAKRHLPHGLWRAVHRLSLPLFAFGTVHGVTVGTDASSLAYLAATVAAVVLVAAVYALRRLPMGSRAIRRA